MGNVEKATSAFSPFCRVHVLEVRSTHQTAAALLYDFVDHSLQLLKPEFFKSIDGLVPQNIRQDL